MKTWREKVDYGPKTPKSLGLMLINCTVFFQQPKIGGVVTGHMDATYLIGEPVDRVFGLWFALDEATTENGCLWFIPGSHKGIVKKI